MGERISKTEFAFFCGQLANAVDGFAFAPIIFVLYDLHSLSSSILSILNRCNTIQLLSMTVILISRVLKHGCWRINSSYILWRNRYRNILGRIRLWSRYLKQDHHPVSLTTSKLRDPGTRHTGKLEIGTSKMRGNLRKDRYCTYLWTYSVITPWCC